MANLCQLYHYMMKVLWFQVADILPFCWGSTEFVWKTIRGWVFNWARPKGCLSCKLPSRNQQLGQSEHPSLNLPPPGGMKLQPLSIFLSLAKIYTGLYWVTCSPLSRDRMESALTAHPTAFKEEVIPQSQLLSALGKLSGCWPAKPNTFLLQG